MQTATTTGATTIMDAYNTPPTHKQLLELVAYMRRYMMTEVYAYGIDDVARSLADNNDYKLTYDDYQIIHAQFS